MNNRNFILILAGTLVVGALAGVAIRGNEAPSPAPKRPVRTQSASAPRDEGVWEKAARENAEFEAEREAAAAREAARLAAERAAAPDAEELERRARQEEARAKIERARDERIEQGLLDSALVNARIDANESAAIATLRGLAASQAMAMASGVIDTNADGTGEYAFLAELAGSAPIREHGADGPMLGERRLDPPLLPPAFGQVRATSAGNGVVERTGYLFQVFLPSKTYTGVGEDGAGGAGDNASAVDAGLAAKHYCAYAWPVEAGTTGNRTFFLSEVGEVRAMPGDPEFSGQNAPPFSAAYEPPHMNAKSPWELVD